MQYITSAYAAEQNAARILQEIGYTDAVVTPVGPDGGIDVIATKALGQVKWQGAAVGRPEVQQLFGSRGTDYSKALFFFAAAGYTEAAIDYANAASIALFTYDPLGEVTAINEHAYDQLRDSDVAGRAPLHSLSLARANNLYAYLKFQGVPDHDRYVLIETDGGALVMEHPDPSIDSFMYAEITEGPGPNSGLGIWVPMSEIESPTTAWRDLRFSDLYVSNHEISMSFDFFLIDYRAATFAAGIVGYIKEEYPDKTLYSLDLANGIVSVSGTDLEFSHD